MSLFYVQEWIIELPGKMEVQADMLCLLAQPQRELELNLKTNNTQNCQKIKLYGSSTTKHLKKPHSSRWVVGVESQRQAESCRDRIWYKDVAAMAEQTIPHSHIVDKNREGYLGSKQFQHQARLHSPGF